MCCGAAKKSAHAAQIWWHVYYRSLEIPLKPDKLTELMLKNNCVHIYPYAALEHNLWQRPPKPSICKINQTLASLDPDQCHGPRVKAPLFILLHQQKQVLNSLPISTGCCVYRIVLSPAKPHRLHSLNQQENNCTLFGAPEDGTLWISNLPIIANETKLIDHLEETHQSE